MTEPLLAIVVGLFLLWPVIGQIALGLFNYSRKKADKAGEIGETREPSEILARMYLWPVLLYKYRKAARKLDHSN